MSLLIPKDLITATGQQLAAMSTQHSRWLAVTAGAGSGKTWVLSWRYVLLIEGGARVSEIVAITFTRKAQQEMAARVAELIEGRLAELDALIASGSAGEQLQDVETRAKHLREAREQFFSHRITTIDSFCHTQLQQHALEVGLEPGFELVLEEEQAEVEADVIQGLRQWLSSRAGELALADLLGTGHPGGTDTDTELGQAAAGFLLLHEWLSAWSIDGLVTTLFHQDREFERLMQAWADKIGVSLAQLRTDHTARLSFTRLALEHANGPWFERLTATRLDAIDYTVILPGLAPSNMREAIAGVTNALQRAIDSVPSGDKKCEQLLSCFSGLVNGGSDFSTLNNSLVGGSVPKARLALEGQQVTYEEATALRNKLKDATKGLKVDELVEQRSAELLLALNDLLPALRRVRANVLRGRVTFADLRDRLAGFITPGASRSQELADAAGRSVAEGIRWLMIDEFQDTDPAQWDLFSRLLEVTRNADGRYGMNLMVVGDAKQSIYRFRGADASVFGHAVERVVEANKQQGSHALPLEHPVTREQLARPNRAGGGWELPEAFRSGVIELAVNFRSAAPPLDTGNALFRQIFEMRRPLLEASGEREFPGPLRRKLFDTDARPQDLTVGDKVHEIGDGWVKLVPVRAGGGRGGDDDFQTEEEQSESDLTGVADPMLAEAELLASEVRQMLQPGADGSPPVAAKAEEIAVLVRTHNQVDTVRAALAAAGIPYAVTGGDRLLNRQETVDLIALLTALTDPGEDLATLGVLRSPYVGLSDPGVVTLLRFGLEPGQFPGFWQLHRRWRRAVSILKDQCEDASPQELRDLAMLSATDRAAAIRGLECINRWRVLAAEDTPSQTLRTILAESGAWAFGAGPNHAQYAANLNRLFSMLVEHEARSGTLAGFASRLFSRWSGQEPRSREGQPEEGSGGVQVMTIHQSKGLGFGIVIIPFTHGRMRSDADAFVMESSWRNGGAALPLMAVSASSVHAGDARPVAQTLLRDASRFEESAELRRLFYVAWTRARRGVVMHLGYPKPNKAGPKPIDPDSGPSFAAMVKCALGGQDAQESHVASTGESADCVEELRSGLQLLAQYHSRSAELPHGVQAAAALKQVSVAEFHEPPAPVIEANPLHRGQIARLAQLADSLSVTPGVTGASDASVGEMLAPLWRERDLMGATATPTLSGRPWDAPKVAATGILPAPAREARTVAGIADTEFGTIVHETIRHHLPGVPSGATGDPSSTAAGIARRLLGANPDAGLLEAATAHARNGIAVVTDLVHQARLAGAGTVLSEWGVHHPGLGNRRIDLAIETAPGEWLVVDFKTSDPDLFTDHSLQRREQRLEYRQQLRAYAQIVADAAKSAGRPAKTVRGCLLLTVNGSLGEGAEFQVV